MKVPHFSKIKLVFLFLLFTPTLAYSQDRDPEVVNYTPKGRSVVIEGETIIVELRFPYEVSEIEGSFPVLINPESLGEDPVEEPQNLFFYYDPSRKVARTLLSAPLDAVPGTYKFYFSTPQHRWSVDYTVVLGKYRESILQLAPSYSRPSGQVSGQGLRDFYELAEIYKRRTEKLWLGAFIHPVRSRHSNNFGVKRTVNNIKRYRHTGLDYSSPLGTHAFAMQNGVVALSKNHRGPGQTICLDHGGGIFTRYIHLSARYVSEGDLVQSGQVIGLTGNTGAQKPAPHLHLDTIINGVSTNPLVLMNNLRILSSL